MHPLTIWLALAGSTWSLFACAEDQLTPGARAAIVAWLRGQTSDWAGTFGAVWDSLWRAPQQAGMRVLRVWVVLQVTAFLLLCLSGVLYPGTSGIMFLVFFLYAPLPLGLLALTTMLSGYVSLLGNRLLLQVAIQWPVSGRWFFWLVSTSLVTGVLALLAWALGFVVLHLCARGQLLRYPVTWISGYVEFVLQGGRGSAEALLEAVQLRPVLVPRVTFPSFGIWLYTPCVALVWGWLYVLSGSVIRCATARGFLRVADGRAGLLDLDTRPLRSVGVVAAGLLSVVYWIAMYLRRT